MIDRQYKAIVFECDSCPEILNTGEEEWADAKAEFDAQGWKAEKVSGTAWEHSCPRCG